MSSRGEAGGGVPTVTAHERFKSRSRLRFWVGITLAAAIHLALLFWGPALHYDSAGGERGETMQALRLIPLGEVQRVEIIKPAPPLRSAGGEQSQRSARSESRRRGPKLAGAPLPRASAPVLSADAASLIESAGRVRYAPPAIEVPPLPPPAPAPPEPESGLGRFKQVNALMEKPELLNRSQVRRALLRAYPRELQRAGVEGAVIVWFWIDEKGKVEKYEIRGSSGHQALDAAAERVIPIMKFRPARERGETVPVIVTLPIRFETD